jgi:hypothetical protein
MKLMVVYLEMTTKDVTLFSSMFYITGYQCKLHYGKSRFTSRTGLN